MAWYNYECIDCREQAERIKGSALVGDEEWEVTYETTHSMMATAEQLKEALVCPRCGGGRAVRSYKECNVICYVRGNGYLDKAGCHRDMNLHKLLTDDPYADMREPGEADDLALRLQRGGQHNPRSRYFAGASGTADAPATEPPKSE